METKLQQEINNVLKPFPKYWNENTLLKNKVIEDIRTYDEKLMTVLLSNELIRNTYSLQLPSGLIFKVEDFISMLRFKNYWDNSFTKYTNEIGLTSENKYLKYNTDVVLDFPHKDGVLEGGMTAEEIGKDEVYYHNTLAKEEIDTLLSPKVLINSKLYTKNGEEKITDFKNEDNLIIKGNNLLALSALKKRFSNQIKMIYIDPPYNTGKDSFKYNDRFNRSTWLTFMKNRIEIAYDLLQNDGLIFINIDNNEQAYLTVLMDEIFEKRNHITTLVWENKEGGGKSDSKFFKNKHEFILVYAKNVDKAQILPVNITNEARYKERDEYEETRGKYYTQKLGMGSIQYSKALDYPIETPDGSYIYPSDNNNGKKAVWRWGKKKFKWGLENGFIIFKKNNNDEWVVYTKQYLKADNEGNIMERKMQPLGVINKYSNTQSEKHLKQMFEESIFKYSKPEGLISYLVDISTNEKDLVLDFFMGSATTPSVAMKMNRRFIGVEQMNYINTVSVPRLQKVIDGEQGGISKDVEWQGGGSFVYAELYSLNEEYLQAIQDCSSTEALEHVIDKMKTSAYLNFKVDLDKATTQDENFKSLSLAEQKDVLIQVLDMNRLYLNYSEIEDSQYEIPDSVKEFNHSFYQEEGDTDE
ncbi:site-specific DNA-methyltransferase [Salinicoccus sp. ID82-1]|uniref:site-specific DNA-methyltransferase n=1 Tax=Salinicoccus sp. ID82-1 TaxID=2820269 RepID=UPI001F1FAC56|nr:site-specific DNA-methyltransferase [Salinicoccus sp. ID82-1]MCG1010906.1 site-specific DNA-methyltransferase [Salinicoccus sp. ID82-1]